MGKSKEDWSRKGGKPQKNPCDGTRRKERGGEGGGQGCDDHVSRTRLHAPVTPLDPPVAPPLSAPPPSHRNPLRLVSSSWAGREEPPYPSTAHGVEHPHRALSPFPRLFPHPFALSSLAVSAVDRSARQQACFPARSPGPTPCHLAERTTYSENRRNVLSTASLEKQPTANNAAGLSQMPSGAARRF